MMIKLAPYQYIHVLDKNKNITRLEEGPYNFFPKDHEEVVTGNKPLDMIILPLDSFALIDNPVKRNDKGQLEMEDHGEVKVRFGEQEYRTDRLYPEPFPLYPGESCAK